MTKALLSIPPLVTGKNLKTYFKSHVTKDYNRKNSSGNFYVLEKPLHVFKKVITPRGSDVIANLIIPINATVFVRNDAFDERGDACRKMRADKAFVYSMFKRSSLAPLDVAESGWDSSFKYKVGELVTPKHSFSFSGGECDSGIHFFLNLQDALSY